MLLNLWASWCVPCREEMPVLAAYAAQLGAVAVLGVNVQDQSSAALGLLADLGVHYPSVSDPDKAAQDFVTFVPEWKGKEIAVKAAFNYYAKLVYVGQKDLGEINVERLTRLQDFYLAKGIIQKKTPVDELFTNQFVQ